MSLDCRFSIVDGVPRFDCIVTRRRPVGRRRVAPRLQREARKAKQRAAFGKFVADPEKQKEILDELKRFEKRTKTVQAKKAIQQILKRLGGPVIILGEAIESIKDIIKSEDISAAQKKTLGRILKRIVEAIPEPAPAPAPKERPQRKPRPPIIFPPRPKRRPRRTRPARPGPGPRKPIPKRKPSKPKQPTRRTEPAKPKKFPPRKPIQKPPIRRESPEKVREIKRRIERRRKARTEKIERKTGKPRFPPDVPAGPPAGPGVQPAPPPARGPVKPSEAPSERTSKEVLRDEILRPGRAPDVGKQSQVFEQEQAAERAREQATPATAQKPLPVIGLLALPFPLFLGRSPPPTAKTGRDIDLPPRPDERGEPVTPLDMFPEPVPEPVPPLDMFPESVPPIGGSLPLSQPRQEAKRQCEEVTRRRRRKGKCREGFFREKPNSTEFITWREVDCVTRRAKSTKRGRVKPRAKSSGKDPQQQVKEQLIKRATDRLANLRNFGKIGLIR